jgi:hypothetical protein
LWKEEYGDKSLRGQMKAKMAALNRPSYRRTIEAMIAEWNVSLVGLDDPLSFIDLRDTLVHTGQVPNDDCERLAALTITLEALFERMIAAWLGVKMNEHNVLGGA